MSLTDHQIQLDLLFASGEILMKRKRCIIYQVTGFFSLVYLCHMQSLPKVAKMRKLLDNSRVEKIQLHSPTALKCGNAYIFNSIFVDFALSLLILREKINSK